MRALKVKLKHLQKIICTSQWKTYNEKKVELKWKLHMKLKCMTLVSFRACLCWPCCHLSTWSDFQPVANAVVGK